MQKLKIAAMGVEHRHIFGQLEGMLNLDCEFVGWWTENDNRISKDLEKKFPDIILLDSVIVITKDNLILKKGNAYLHILRKLKKLKPIVFILSLFPLKIIDFFYTIIAKTRYKIFGKYNSCPVVEKKYLKKIIK